jgi:hypothetical protein
MSADPWILQFELKDAVLASRRVAVDHPEIAAAIAGLVHEIERLRARVELLEGLRSGDRRSGE